MPKKLLTRKKLRWINQFKPTAVIKGSPLYPNYAAKRKYQKRMDSLVKQMREETEREIRKLFDSQAAEQYFSEDASLASQARILTGALMRKYEKLFNNRALGITKQMVKDQTGQSKSSLHSSLAEMSGGLSIKTDLFDEEINEAITASVAQSVDLIKSIPTQYIERVQGSVMRSITSPTKGGLQELFKDLKKYGKQSDRRVALIARDQTRKVYNTINLARSKKVGITKGIWVHTKGANKPRQTHLKFDGQVFDLEKGLYDSAVGRWVLPGQEPECGCTFTPVIEFDDGEEVK